MPDLLILSALGLTCIHNVGLNATLCKSFGHFLQVEILIDQMARDHSRYRRESPEFVLNEPSDLTAKLDHL